MYRALRGASERTTGHLLLRSPGRYTDWSRALNVSRPFRSHTIAQPLLSGCGMLSGLPIKGVPPAPQRVCPQHSRLPAPPDTSPLSSTYTSGFTPSCCRFSTPYREQISPACHQVSILACSQDRGFLQLMTPRCSSPTLQAQAQSSPRAFGLLVTCCVHSSRLFWVSAVQLIIN